MPDGFGCKAVLGGGTETGGREAAGYQGIAEQGVSIIIGWLQDSCEQGLFVFCCGNCHSSCRYAVPVIRRSEKLFVGERAVMSADVYRRADIAEGELEELKEKVRLKRKIQIYEISFPGGAFTMGYFHPVIMIPENLGKQQRDIVLMHEMYHIKRHDVLFKFLVAAAVCIHWFNPLIYFLAGLINRNCEMNCDERVIGNLSREERLLYGREIFRQGALAQREREVLVRLSGDRSLTKPSLIGDRVIDEEGNIYEVDLNESARTGCTHSTLTSGQYYEHVKSSSGGCGVRTYSSERCADCDSVFLEDFISEAKYAKCHHG